MALFKEIALVLSRTEEVMISEAVLELEFLKVKIQLQYISKKETLSEELKYAVEASYIKLCKYNIAISNPDLMVAIVLDPRCKLEIFAKTQDPQADTRAATKAIRAAYLDSSNQFEYNHPIVKKSKWDDDELDEYLMESRIPFNSDCLWYWSTNQFRFPVLAKIAKDFLVKQSTMKDVVGIFSEGRRLGILQ